MSQFWVGVNQGSLPPEVATEYIEDVGTAIPAFNILNIEGGELSTPDINGIQTTGSGNTVTINLTNRVSGDVTTTNSTPTTLFIFGLGSTPAVFSFTGEVTAFDITDQAGASYGVLYGVKTNGIVATEIAVQTTTNFEDQALLNAGVTVTVSGNNLVFQVTGIAGKTIDWDALFTYRFVT